MTSPTPTPTHERVLALDLNPLHWLGSAASAAVGDVWQAAMTGLWSAALWLLKLAFQVIDAFTTPDLSASGPMAAVLPTTLWIGATLAVLMMFVQLTVALIRRDGQSIGRVLLGLAQFGLVWVGYLAIAAALLGAADGLAKGILQQMLHVDTFSGVDLSASWPNQISDATSATVLGVLSLLIIIPAAFFYVLIMFVREAALIILVATAPISAAGLLSDTGKVWFWKTLRWFIACLLIAPTAALVLGIGVKVSDGVITTPGAANLTTAQSVGEAVVGCIVIAIGACCPLILFRLLAFIEPSTASGAALRQSWSDAGGLSGIMSGGAQPSGSSAATESGGDGRSGGESGAESQTQSRLSSALGAFGTGMQIATMVAHRSADIGADILGHAGVGSPGYTMTPTDERVSRRSNGSGSAPGRGSSGQSDSGGDGAAPPSGTPGGGSGGPDGAGGPAGSGGGAAPLPEPPAPTLPDGGLPGAGGAGGGGAAAGAGGGEAAAAAVAL